MAEGLHFCQSGIPVLRVFLGEILKDQETTFVAICGEMDFGQFSLPLVCRAGVECGKLNRKRGGGSEVLILTAEIVGYPK
ncbi:MAG: hypothetical protein MUF31_05320 [Akkermansiaceae bacterium]|nr:hypothetical protein [Akkermansiaceae bacterium]